MRWSIDFLEPWWLLLLLAIPWIVWQSLGSLSGLGPFRRWLAVAMRVSVVVLLAFALADLQFVRKSDRSCTLFVLDQSQSIPTKASENALASISESIRNRPRTLDPAGLVVFGKTAKIELPPAEYPRDREIRSVGSMLDRQYTDAASGLRLALGAFPPDCARRIVLISDGNQNRGDVLAQAIAARQMGVPVDVVPIEYQYDSEVLVDKVVLPPELKKGDTANLKIVLRSARPTAGLLRLNQMADGSNRVVLEQRVELHEGLNVLTRQITIDDPDFYTYEATFEPDPDSGDRLARNNQASAFTWIRGEGRILLIHRSQDRVEPFVEKLKQDKIAVTLRTPDLVRQGLADLRQYDAVVVCNVPAEELSDAVQEALAANTRELGAGLVMIGGEDSFGAGGYTGSALEKALPVDMQIKANKVRGKGALVLIMHACEIPEGNFWQKRIAKLAIQTLGGQDECGLLFWSMKSSWLFPLQPVGDRARMFSRIDQMTPGDMPDFDSTMRMGVQSLIRAEAVHKHMIIISDGDPQPPSQAVLQSFKDGSITCTAVAVAAHGSMERTVMRQIASSTGGRFYEATNPNTLPSIYIKETRVVARPLIFERSPAWNPIIAYPTEPVAGLPRELPPILGYVMTTPKPTAEVAVVSPEPADNDVNPILAHWQYGLGKSVAFTSDLGWKWAGAWPASPVYGKFWSQVVRWVMRGGESENLAVSTQEKDGQVTVVVNAMDKGSEFLNFLRIQGKLIRPDMTVGNLDFRQTEPGKYEAQFPAEQSGSYFLRMGYRQPDGKQGFVSTGLNISYPPEYRDVRSNRDLMENVASLGGGRVVELQEMGKADFFPRDEAGIRRLQDAWPWLLLVTLGVFLCDAAVRRIAIEPAEVSAMMRRWWAQMRRRPAPARAEATVERLRAAKAEVGEQLSQKRRFDAGPKTESPGTIAGDESSVLNPPKKPTAGGPSSSAKPPGLTPQKESPAESESPMERLLRAKKKTWEEKDKKPGSE